jgi:hypothetical protein
LGGAAAGPALSYRGLVTVTSGSAGTTETFPIDIGSATADRYMVVAVGLQNGGTITNVAVAGTNLTLDIQQNGGNTSAIYSGLVSTGSGTLSVVVTYAASHQFFYTAVHVWALTGLAQNNNRVTAKVAGVGLNIGVTTPFFVITAAFGSIAAVDYSTSTPQVPTVRADPNNVFTGADMAGTTTATYTLTPKAASSFDQAAATYF